MASGFRPKRSTMTAWQEIQLDWATKSEDGLLLSKFGMLSVNQLNAQMKLVEMWKAINVDDYPLKVEQQARNGERVSTRADTTKKPIEIGRTNQTIKPA